MIKQGKFGVVVFVVLALSVTNLQAEIIIINLTAEITSIDDPGIFDGQLNIGDLITGSYVYNSDTPDNNPSDTLGAYYHFSAPYGIFLSSGGFIFQTDPDNVDFLVGVSDNHGDPISWDRYNFRSYNNLPLLGGTPVFMISWQLDDDTCAALSSDALPTTAPVLEDWESIFGLRVGLGEKGDSLVIADVISAELPEPATVFLLGLDGLVLLRKHRA